MIEEKLVLWKESLQKNMNQTKYAIGQLIVIVWMAFRSVGHYLKRLIFGFAEAVCVFRDFCRYLLMYFLGEDVKGTLYGAVMFLMALSAGFCLWLGFALSAHSELQTLSFVGAGVMLLGIPVFWVEYLKYVKQRQEA